VWSASYPEGTRGLHPGSSVWGVKYTTYLELVSSLRICGAVPPLSHVFVKHGNTETIYLALLLQIIIF